MKTLKSILLTALFSGSMLIGFASCSEEEVLPTKGSETQTQEPKDAWD